MTCGSPNERRGCLNQGLEPTFCVLFVDAPEQLRGHFSSSSPLQVQLKFRPKVTLINQVRPHFNTSGAEVLEESQC